MAETQPNQSNLAVSQGKVTGNVPASPFAFSNPSTQEALGPSNIPGSPFVFANPLVPQGDNSSKDVSSSSQGNAPQNVPKSPLALAIPQGAEAENVENNQGGATQGVGGVGPNNFPPQQPPQAVPSTGTLTNECYRYLPLLQAISKGDLDTVKSFLNRWPGASMATIDVSGSTALNFACGFGQVQIVKVLLEKISPDYLAATDRPGFESPLQTVTIAGNIEIAKALVEKNHILLEITDSAGNLPVAKAAVAEKKEMTWYLYHETPPHVLLDNNGFHGVVLLHAAIYSKMLDLALDLFERYPWLAFTIAKSKSTSFAPICTIAKQPALFPTGCQLGLWQGFLYSCIQVKLQTQSSISNPTRDQSLLRRLFISVSKLLGIHQVYRLKKRHRLALKLIRGMSEQAATLSSNVRTQSGLYDAFILAVKCGTVEFLVEMIKINPDLAFVVNLQTQRSLLLMAVEFRQEKIFNLLKGLDGVKEIMTYNVDVNGNMMLHIAGPLSPPNRLANIAGAAMQMQRELQWFKEVESIVPDMLKGVLNNSGSAANEVFTEEHKSLQKAAEKWMKGTATSFSLVAALIITVTFAAAFTVPGGTDENFGLPIRLKDTNFMVFIVSNFISFFASCTSLLIFLGILTARYSESDFLKSLPTKMIGGLSTLFVSIAAMMVAFSSALFTMLHDKSWIGIPVILIACLPVVLFLLLQYPLLKDMIVSTYGRGILERKKKRWI